MGDYFSTPSGVGGRNDYEEAGLSEDEAEADLADLEGVSNDDELLFDCWIEGIWWWAVVQLVILVNKAGLEIPRG